MANPPATGALRPVLRQESARLVATFVLVPRVEVVEALAYAGFDAIVLDLEHGPFTVPELPPLVAAAQGAGAFVLVRVGELSPAAIGAVLDTGVDGVVVPHVASAADARAAVAAARFPPRGSRSLNPYVRAARYDASASFTDEADDAVAIVVMVEGVDAVAALPEIATVPGVDAVFVGPVDLSASVGFPGQPEHPDVVAKVAEVISTLTGLGVGSSVYCPTPDAARRWRQAGARLVVVSADIAMAADGFRSYVHALTESPLEGP